MTAPHNERNPGVTAKAFLLPISPHDTGPAPRPWAGRLFVMLLLLLSAAWLGGCKSGSNEASAGTNPAQPPEVRVVSAAVRPLHVTIPVTGSLLSTVQMDVKTEAAGRLIQAPPREGELVTKGQVIARLDDTGFRLAAQQARAAVSVAEAGVARARIAVEHGDREFDRARKVKESGGITVKDLQSAEWAARDARAQLELGEAQLQQARETLAMAEKKLRDCTIHAAISGAVQAHLQNEGVYMDINQVIARLVDNSRLEMEVTVPSADLGRVRAGQLVQFTVDAYPGEAFTGKVLQVAPALIEQSRSAKVRVFVANGDRKLKAGMFVRGDIVTGSRAEALMLPVSALVRTPADPNKAAILVAENGSVRRRDVELGIEQNGSVEVLRGLQAGEAVLADPSMAPAEGQAVRVVKASTP